MMIFEYSVSNYSQIRNFITDKISNFKARVLEFLKQY